MYILIPKIFYFSNDNRIESVAKEVIEWVKEEAEEFCSGELNPVSLPSNTAYELDSFWGFFDSQQEYANPLPLWLE